MEATRIKYKKHTIQISHDDFSMHPRTDFDNLGSMVMFHNRYNLPNEGSYNKNDFNSWAELEKDIIRKEDIAVIIPVYMYEHSGVVLNTNGFSCPWDSGQVGFIFISKAKARTECSWKQITKTRRERLEKHLIGEVEVYSQYLNGDVYGYTVLNEEGEEIEAVDGSSWGYFGCDHEKSGLIGEAKSVINWEIKRIKEDAKKNNLQIEMELA
jgi:hypothetical protein